MSTALSANVDLTDLTAATSALKQARDRAIAWLLDQISPSGVPANADVGNGWSRLPWTLAVAGETTTAHAVLRWVENERLTVTGTLEGAASYGNPAFAPYPLGHVAMGAMLLERPDVAGRILSHARSLQDPRTGGLFSGGALADACDILSTAQLGLAAVLAGDHDIAEGVRQFLSHCWLAQPETPTRLYAAMRGTEVLSDPPAPFANTLVVDFTKPRQSYFYPGIAAAFLAAYGSRYRDDAALELASRYLQLNIQGTADQFDDPESVQICKFGWGVAATQIADTRRDYSAHVLRMARWFIEHQRADGAWTPSTFISAQPSRVDVMTKTAEHAMEASSLLAALGVLAADHAGDSSPAIPKEGH